MSGDTRRLIRALASLVLIVIAVLVLAGYPTTQLTWACFLAAGVGLLTTT